SLIALAIVPTAAMAITGCGTARHDPPGTATLTCRTTIGSHYTTAQWIGKIADDQARQNKAGNEKRISRTSGHPAGTDGNDLRPLASYLSPGVHKYRWAQGGRYAVRGDSTLVIDAMVFSQDVADLIFTSEAMGGWAPPDRGIYRAIGADIFLMRED